MKSCLLHQAHHGIHGLVEVEVGRVDRRDAGRGGHEVDHLGVPPVSLAQLVRRRGGVRREFGGTPGNPNRFVGGEQDAHRRIGGDDRRDVAALDHDPGRRRSRDQPPERVVQRRRAPRGCARRRSPTALTRGSRISSVTSMSPTRTTVPSSPSSVAYGKSSSSATTSSASVGVDAALERDPGQRAVGGAGVEVGEAERARGGLAARSTCRCRPGRRRRRRSAVIRSASMQRPARGPRAPSPAGAPASGSTEISAKPDLRLGRVLEPQVLHVDALLADLGEQAGELARLVVDLDDQRRVALVLPVLAGDARDARRCRPASVSAMRAARRRARRGRRARRARRRGRRGSGRRTSATAPALAPRICTHSSGSLDAMRVVSRRPCPASPSAAPDRVAQPAGEQRGDQLRRVRDEGDAAVVLRGVHLDRARRRGRGSCPRSRQRGGS